MSSDPRRYYPVYFKRGEKWIFHHFIFADRMTAKVFAAELMTMSAHSGAGEVWRICDPHTMKSLV